MREPAGRLVPSRRSAPVLALLWTLACAGIFAMHGIGVRLFVGTLFSAVLLWLAFLDVRDGFLYDCITLPFAFAGVAFSAGGLTMPLIDAILGGTLCGVLFYCLYIAARGGMGGGDVKFALGIGLRLGWESAIIAVWTAFLIGGMMAAFLLLTRRKGRRDALPFGPCLAAGGYLAFLCGDVIWRLYWGLA